MKESRFIQCCRLLDAYQKHIKGEKTAVEYSSLRAKIINGEEEPQDPKNVKEFLVFKQGYDRNPFGGES